MRQLDPDVRALALPARDGNTSPQPLDDVTRDREAQSRAGPACREVGVEDPRQIFCSNADAAIPDLDGDPLRAQSEGLQADWFGWGRVRPGHDGVPGVHQDVDQGQPQPFGVGADRAQGPVQIPRHRQRRIHAHRLGGIVAEGVEIGGRHVELDRFGEVEHLGHDAVEPGDFLVDVRHCRPERLRGHARPPEAAEGRLDDHERVADLVRDDGRQPAERRQPLAVAGLALKPRDRVGHRIEGRREELGVFVLPSPPHRHPDSSRQVACRGHLAHRRGDRSQGPCHRARDAVADERGREHGDDRREEDFPVNRAQEAQPVCPRP